MKLTKLERLDKEQQEKILEIGIKLDKGNRITKRDIFLYETILKSVDSPKVSFHHLILKKFY